MDKKLQEALKTVSDKMAKVTKNAKGYNYQYTDLPHLWSTIEPTIEEAGFIVYNHCDGEYVITTAVHEAGEVSSKLPVSFAKGNNPQELGSAITYFRRYNLLLLFNVVVEDDDGKKSTNAIKKAPQVETVSTSKEDLPF